MMEKAVTDFESLRKSTRLQEKRKNERLDVVFSCRVLFLGTESHCLIQNLSEDGFNMFCMRRFHEGTEFNIELTVPNFKTLRLYGRVTRIEEAIFESQRGYSHGIELMTIPYEYEEFLEGLLRVRTPDENYRKLAEAGLTWWRP
jgi:hypothetical protein